MTTTGQGLVLPPFPTDSFSFNGQKGVNAAPGTAPTDVATFAQTQPGVWIPVLGGVGFQNSWVNTGAPWAPASYRLSADGKHVELVGAVSVGAGNTTIFQLPPALRPLTQRGLPSPNTTNGYSNYILVTSASAGTPGAVFASTLATPTIVLDDITFPIDI